MAVTPAATAWIKERCACRPRKGALVPTKKMLRAKIWRSDWRELKLCSRQQNPHPQTRRKCQNFHAPSTSTSKERSEELLLLRLLTENRRHHHIATTLQLEVSVRLREKRQYLSLVSPLPIMPVSFRRLSAETPRLSKFLVPTVSHLCPPQIIHRLPL